MGKTRAIGAARKLKKFRTTSFNKMTNILTFHEKNKKKMAKAWCADNTWRRPGMFDIRTYLPKPNICDKCGCTCTPEKPKENKFGLFPNRDEWKKPKRGIDAYNAFTSKCYKTYRFTGEKMVKIFLTDKYGGGSLFNGIDEDVVIAAFERDGDAVDINGLDWT